MKTKLLAVSDIHQYGHKWKQLVKIVEEQKPEIVAIAGDLYPKDNGILWQPLFIKSLKKYATRIRKHSELVFILGNDDNSTTIPAIDEGEKEDLWYCVHDRMAEIKGFEFCGCSLVPDYPFAYKHWVAKESPDNLRKCPESFGAPCIINENNKWETITDFKLYLMNKESIAEHLEKTAAKVKDPKKSIWLIHAPPAHLALDVCAHGAKVGSYAVLKFLEKFQPLLSIHGHIHESPEYNGHKWSAKIDDTFCVQAGQLDRYLYYVDIEIEDGKILGMKHSIYGESKYDFTS